jgi:hypothetical protein
MGGGLMQLVAYGAQDIYLTGNPQITFFKVVYRRHTNFSMEAIKQTFNGTADFGNDVSATISRNGDLVYRMYLEHDAVWTAQAGSGANIGLVERYGDSLIKECEIEIGGQKIDKHTSMWNRVWSDLTEFNPSGYFGGTPAPVAGTAKIASNGTLHQLMTGNGYGFVSGNDTTPAFSVVDNAIVNGFKYEDGASANGIITVNNIFLPLNFWFCRNPGLALPLIALQYHEVKVKMTFETHANLARNVAADAGDGIVNTAISSAFAGTPTLNLWCDYIYLDTDERRRFAQVSHEYLIEQLQYSENTITTQTPSIDLNFNHPVKELIWCSQNTGTLGRNGPPGASSAGTTKFDATAGPVSLDAMGGNWQLKLNGHDRFKERDTRYFTRTQVWEHHTGYGAVPTSGADLDGSYNANECYDVAKVCGADSIAVYSFALKPEEHQPSGTCNFSRIDNAQLVGSSLVIEDTQDTTVDNTVNTGTETMKLTIFAVNYNVLRIMSGMGGLAYSN